MDWLQRLEPAPDKGEEGGVKPGTARGLRLPIVHYAIIVLVFLLVFTLGLLVLHLQNRPQPAPQAETAPATPSRVNESPGTESTESQTVPQFAVQIGAFENRSEAEAAAKKLSSDYQRETVIIPVEVSGKTLYRVRIFVETQAEAEALAARLRQEQKLDSWTVPPQ